jgi:hypothetical protein
LKGGGARGDSLKNHGSFRLFQLSQTVQIINLWTEVSLWSFYKWTWDIWVHGSTILITNLWRHKVQSPVFSMENCRYVQRPGIYFLTVGNFLSQKIESAFYITRCAPKRGGMLAPIPTESKLGGGHLVDMMISKVSCDIRFSQNQPLKLADDLYIGISGGKKNSGPLRWT